MARIITFSRYLLVASILIFALPALAEDNGYSGVLAPSDDSTPNAADKLVPAYDGVISGSTYQSTIPHSDEVIHDLGIASVVYAPHPPIAGPKVDFSATQHSKVNDKPAVVFMVEQQVKLAMASITNKNLSNSQREQNAKEAFTNLSVLANGLRNKEKIPDETYKNMNLTDAYIKDEHDGNAQALTQIDAALETLKQLQ